MCHFHNLIFSWFNLSISSYFSLLIWPSHHYCFINLWKFLWKLFRRLDIQSSSELWLHHDIIYYPSLSHDSSSNHTFCLLSPPPNDSGVNKRRHKKSRGFSGAKHETLHTGGKISAKKRWDSDMSNFFEKVPKNALFWQNFGKFFTKTSKSPKIFAGSPPNPRWS